MGITAAQVKELRDRTGAGMMDCKKALAESNGDMEAALDFLRKKGLAVAEKRKGRATNEGIVRAEIGDGVATLVEVNCETDFVARGDDFQAFVEAVSKAALAEKPASLEALLALPLNGGLSAKDQLTEMMGKIGENMNVSRYQFIKLDGPGLIESYIHAGGRVGVLVALGAPSADAAAKPEFKEIAHELTLHIAFANPECIDRDGVPKELVEREERISRERAIEQGKPEKIIDNIVKGQINKFYGEVVLLEQGYVKEEKTAVKDWLTAQGKALGGTPVIQSFVRFALGEGAEEEEEG